MIPLKHTSGVALIVCLDVFALLLKPNPIKNDSKNSVSNNRMIADISAVI